MNNKKTKIFLFLSLLFIPVTMIFAGTITNPYKYAWSNNVGYINFENVTVSNDTLGGYAWSTNAGFINFNPAQGGITNNSLGNLSGSVWGEQLGWIDFNGVSINPNTGRFSGTATGDLVGTITFNCLFCDVRTDWRPSSGGGGGGGGSGGGSGSTNQNTSVVLSGRAYPLSKVTVLKDGTKAVTTIAGPDSKFAIRLDGLSVGNYTFGVYGEDNSGIQSSLFTFPASLTTGSTAEISGIFIAPSISVDKSEVKKGDNITIFGQSSPLSEVTISVHSEQEFFTKIPSDTNGVYLLNFDTSVLELGQHTTKSKAAVSSEISDFGKTVNFAVGTKNVLIDKEKITCNNKGDLNSDCKVNLVDFSIAAFWYNKNLNTSIALIEKSRLNGDGKINLADFSIMAYYWTG